MKIFLMSFSLFFSATLFGQGTYEVQSADAAFSQTAITTAVSSPREIHNLGATYGSAVRDTAVILQAETVRHPRFLALSNIPVYMAVCADGNNEFKVSNYKKPMAIEAVEKCESYGGLGRVSYMGTISSAVTEFAQLEMAPAVFAGSTPFQVSSSSEASRANRDTVYIQQVSANEQAAASSSSATYQAQ